MPWAAPAAARSPKMTTTIEAAGMIAHSGPRSRSSHGHGERAGAATSAAWTSESTQMEIANDGTPST